MVLACPRCSRVNPPDGKFCYFDGAALPGGQGTGPLHPGSVPFPMPMVFPNGDACKNFNQLALACHRNWEMARGLLSQGHLEPFFVGLGRLDLAQTARELKQAPDPDRALDQLLRKLPADVLEPAKLMVEPSQINLGHVSPTQDNRFELILANRGMGLLFGAVASNCDWLVLGDGQGQGQRIFQTPHDVRIPVQVLGSKLRASAKPLEGQLFVDSNAGGEHVKVRLEVPVQPFPSGVLTGATTPRQIAQKAKTFPKEAADLFQQGLVEKWYKSNGWTYPVQGPTGSGLGAVQQFFEALGLVKAPQVSLSDTAFSCRGEVGRRLQLVLKISTPEKKPVFAHGWSNVPWLVVGSPQFEGATVRLPFDVTVPASPGQNVLASVTIRANGNQRFVVPVALQVDGLPFAAPFAGLSRAEPFAMPPPLPTRDGNERPAHQSRKPRASNRQSVASVSHSGAFGMGRLVYWSALIGGWSAFAGWLFAEIFMGRGVGDSLFLLVLMVVFVTTALGTGLSQVQSLITSQWQNPIRTLGFGALGGFMGGLVGGFFGNWLFSLFPQRFAILEFFGRVLGWTLLGLTIGICDGALHRNWRRFRNGFIGGACGGFLGGLAFSPIYFLIGSPVSSRAIAFVLLGLCIGFFLGLVKVLLKEAWVTVEEGFRPGRQLILEQDSTTMGTSEKASLIFIAYGAKGVEPVHLRIGRQPDGTFLLEDNQSRSGTLLNGEPLTEAALLENGDLIQFGVNKVRFSETFRTGAKND